jgi:hypothetical protein
MEQAPVTRTCKKCGETKLLELFTGSSTSRFGKSHTCKECTSEKSKNFYYIKYYKPKPKKSKELPTTITCKDCKETKTLHLFYNSANCRFGKLPTCKKCHIKKTSKYYDINKERMNTIKKIWRIKTGRAKAVREPKKFKEPKKPKEQPLTKICNVCKETKDFELFELNKVSKFGRTNTCIKCSKIYSAEYYSKNKTKLTEYYSKNKTKIIEYSKKRSKISIANLDDSYLKSMVSEKLGIRSSEVTDEQLQLQKESIQLHREYQQLKQQLQ